MNSEETRLACLTLAASLVIPGSSAEQTVKYADELHQFLVPRSDSEPPAKPG